MERVPNLELQRKVLDSLAESYNLNTVREGIHLSSLIYCLTKAYLDTKQTMGCTDSEILLFVTGFALEEVLIPKFPNVSSPKYEYEGIVYRPDFVILDDPADDADHFTNVTDLCEIKSTRKGYKNYSESIPEKWIIYQMAGCKIMGTNTYNLIGILVAERPRGELVCETITYTQDEIDSNWDYILARRDVYKEALEKQQVPTPGMHCEDWECGGCRYTLICDAINMSSSEPEED